MLTKKQELERYGRMKDIIKNYDEIADEVKSDLEYFIKTGIPRCPVCKTNMKQQSKYVWQTRCEHMTNLTLCIG